MRSAFDPLPLAQALIRCASVTPADAGAQDVLAAALEGLGFAVHRLPFGTTPNLFARIGAGAPHLCFAGHTDVVPAGAGWQADPFAGTVQDGVLYGRGACDMKGAIAAFVAAAAAHLQSLWEGSISLLITGDEEGPATDGTVRVLEWMQAHGHVPGPLHRGRTHQSPGHGRDDQGRPPRQPQCRADGRGDGRARGLSAPGGQPGAIACWPHSATSSRSHSTPGAHCSSRAPCR